MAGPSEPGRGSRGATNAGYPVKLPRLAAAFAASGPSNAGLNPLPMLTAAVGVTVSLAPLPENRLLLRTSLFRVWEIDAQATAGQSLVVVLPEDVVGDVGLLGAGGRLFIASNPFVLKANVLLMTFVVVAALLEPRVLTR